MVSMWVDRGHEGQRHDQIQLWFSQITVRVRVKVSVMVRIRKMVRVRVEVRRVRVRVRNTLRVSFISRV